MDLMVIWLIGMLTATPTRLCSLSDRATRALVSARQGFEVALGRMRAAANAVSHKIEKSTGWLSEDLPLQVLPEDEFEWE